MPEAVDTSIASKLHPGARYERLLTASAVTGAPVVVTAPSVLETLYGLSRNGSTSVHFTTLARWYKRVLGGPLVRLLRFDGAAAVVAGELRARHPTPPPRRRETRTKPERRVAWVIDIQIAATAWASGYGIATENTNDFELLSHLISALYPETTALDVAGPPEG